MPAVFSRAQLNALPSITRRQTTRPAPVPTPPPTPVPLPFATVAYAFGQFCLPYVVQVTRRRPTGLPQPQ